MTRNNRSFELDFIVLGDNWIFLIDEKSWRGRIVGTDQVWVRPDGSSERSPLSKVDYVARVLKGELSQRVALLQTVSDHFVHGCIVLSQADQLPQLRDPRANDGVFLLDAAVDSLLRLDSRGGNKTVGIARQAILQKVVDLSPRPTVPKMVGLYEVSEARDLRPGVRVMTAQLPREGERKLLVYTARPQDTEFFLREFRALRELRDTGVVAEVGEPFPWSDDFLVLPVTPAKGRTLSASPVSFEADVLVRELRTALAAFEALAVIHARKVIHRAIDPDNVFVDWTGPAPRITFTDFHAARLGDESIAVRLDEEAELEPYAAPELSAGFGFATEQSDVFSLALVFLERFSGLPLPELRVGDHVEPKKLERWDQLGEGLADDLTAFFRLATSVGPMAPTSKETERPSAADCSELLRDLISSVKAAASAANGDALLDARYRVLRKLGEGTSAFTYLVKDTMVDGFFAVKRFKRASAVWEQAKAEFETLRQIQSRSIPRVYDVYPPTSDIHLKMEYIEGATLADLASSFPWALDKWLDLARSLFQAVGVLESRNLLHRDIKLANVVLSDEDGAPVLVDFGFATVADRTEEPAGTPTYLPPEAFSSAQPPATSDLYALGILLHQVLTGELPDRASSPGSSVLSVHPVSGPTARQERVREFVVRLCDPDPRRRFQSTREATDALDSALLMPDPAAAQPGLAELINPWVEQLRGGYRNSSVGNADNRGLDSDFARQTYVPTALDEVLLPAILAKRPRVVFLSGNPGDGKTAFLEMLEADLRHRLAAETQKDESGWEFGLAGHTYRSCFDASEAHGQLSADQQLDRKLELLAGERDPQVPITVVVAVNDGRLADFLSRFGDKYAWLSRATARATGGWVPTDPVWVIDLKQRSLAAPTATSAPVMSRLIDVLADPDRWAICEGCASKTICPMRRNAAILAGGAAPSRARGRLEELLQLAHLRLVRHITMRDLRSTLSFLIAADTSCEEIHAERRGDKPTGATRRWFWQTLFSGTGNDPLESALRGLDPGAAATPHIDRFLSLRRNADQAHERSALFEDGADVEPEVYPNVGEWLVAFRRRLWFHGKEERLVGAGKPTFDLRQLLPYRHSVAFREALRSADARRRDLPLLLQGVTRSEGIIAVGAVDGLSLKVSASEQERLLVVKRFSADRFQLVTDQPPASPVETMPSRLRLELAGGAVNVHVTLDLYELLRRMADGLRPDAEEFQPLLADLATFKDMLLLQESEEMMLVANGRLSDTLRLTGGKIVRAEVTAQ